MDSHPSWYLSRYAQAMLRDTGADMEPIYISSVKGDETMLEEGGLQPSSFHPTNGEERKSRNSDYWA
jgi:hypothetical protein